MYLGVSFFYRKAELNNTLEMNAILWEKEKKKGKKYFWALAVAGGKWLFKKNIYIWLMSSPILNKIHVIHYYGK